MRYVPAGITIATAPDVRIVRVSDYGSRLLRRPRAQLERITAEAHVDAYKVFRADTGAPALPEALPLTRAVQGGEIVVNEEWLVADEAGRQIPVLCNAGPIRDEAGNVVAGVITWHDITELKSAQEHQRLLLLELNHRVKNMLATVQAVADQTFQGAATADARQAFSARIVSLARTHDLLARRSWQQAGLHDVVLQAVAPFEGAPDPRFDIEAGDDVLLQPKAALALSMALHELATNAVKYGRLVQRQRPGERLLEGLAPQQRAVALLVARVRRPAGLQAQSARLRLGHDRAGPGAGAERAGDARLRAGRAGVPDGDGAAERRRRLITGGAGRRRRRIAGPWR